MAPTPSGYLHVGNAVSFLLTDWLARAAGGRLLLRIDDFDLGRARRQYLDDIIAVLAWLGIKVADGPSDGSDLAAWSMSARTALFRAALDELRAAHPSLVFACRCSRRTLGPGGMCVAGCGNSGAAHVPGESVIRLHVPPGSTVQIGRGQPANVPLPVPPGDHVLWRRDDLPAYHLGSVVADEALGVNAVVRGMDLLESTALQLHLAGLLPAPGFAAADFRHHGLITAADGHKLSKSAGAQAHPLTRTPQLRAQIHAWAASLGAGVGIAPGGAVGAGVAVQLVRSTEIVNAARNVPPRGTTSIGS
ncbi:MAG: glutamate--tRNA ligase family protein [Candidatus Nanopelagicales bacterium]